MSAPDSQSVSFKSNKICIIELKGRGLHTIETDSVNAKHKNKVLVFDIPIFQYCFDIPLWNLNCWGFMHSFSLTSLISPTFSFEFGLFNHWTVDQKYLQLVCGRPEPKAAAYLESYFTICSLFFYYMTSFTRRFILWSTHSICNASSCFIPVLIQILIYFSLCAPYLFVLQYKERTRSPTCNILHWILLIPYVIHCSQIRIFQNCMVDPKIWWMKGAGMII